MFKVNIEELKKEFQEKLLKLKKVDEKLKKLVSKPLDMENDMKAQEDAYTENGTKSFLFNGDDSNNYYNSSWNKDDFFDDDYWDTTSSRDEDDIITDPAYSFFPCNIFYEDDYWNSFDYSTDYDTFDDDLSHDPFNDPFDDPFNDW